MSAHAVPQYSDEAAFPRPEQLKSEAPSMVLLPAQWGLTKRELFAAMAMQGMCSAEWAKAHAFDELARWSVEHADALLAALSDEQVTK